jgi:hypothetical protein
MSTTPKATVTTVKMGNLEIEGLLLNDGSFAVAVPQITNLFPYFQQYQDPQKYGAQTLKRLMGNDFKTHKVKTEFNRNITLAVNLLDFERVLRKLDKLSDSVAEILTDDLVGLSLTQLFSDSFGIKFEQEDRQEYLKERAAVKQSFFVLTPCIKSWLVANGKDESPNARFYYSNTMDALNLKLFAKKSKEIKEELGIGKSDLNRDHFSPEALRRLDHVQTLASAYIKDGMHPVDAVIESIQTFKLGVMPYN